MKGIIFDYGGTLDSRGVHWSWIILEGYRSAEIDLPLERFRQVYVEGERELARVRHILPGDTFADVMRKKIAIHRRVLAESGGPELTATQVEAIASHCYESARSCINEARPMLETLADRVPMMLVSNFYGNIDSVLRDFNIRHYFRGIIESAVVGVRKPNPTIFRLGVDVLEMNPADVLVVGDSMRKDIIPAQSLGCATAWVKGRGWTPDEDQATHPITLKSAAELLNLPQCLINFD